MVKKNLRNPCIILWVIFDTGLKFNLQISPVVSIKGFLQVRQAASQAEVNHVEARLEKKQKLMTTFYHDLSGLLY